MTMKPSDVDRRVISPVRNGTDTGVPLTCEDTGDRNPCYYISNITKTPINELMRSRLSNSSPKQRFGDGAVISLGSEYDRRHFIALPVMCSFRKMAHSVQV